MLSDPVRPGRSPAAGGRGLPVAVNLAAPAATRDRFITVIRRLLDRYEVPPSSLIVEITESSVMTKPERSARWAAALGELGVRIATADFGSGPISVAQLTRLPLNESRWDRAFVNCVHHPQERLTFQVLARMAEWLGLTSVVEDQHTATFSVDRVTTCYGGTTLGGLSPPIV